MTKPTAELIAWNKRLAEHNKQQASFQDDRHNRDYHLGVADKHQQTAGRLAEQEARISQLMELLWYTEQFRLEYRKVKLKMYAVRDNEAVKDWAMKMPCSEGPLQRMNTRVLQDYTPLPREAQIELMKPLQDIELKRYDMSPEAGPKALQHPTEAE